jgi:Zn-dependent protease
VQLSSLSATDVRNILVTLFILVISVALHEFGHAKMADLLGDDTPRRQGRVTLNPLAHADPIGTLLLPLVGGVFHAAGGIGGFGWGRPVQWQPHKVKRKWKMTTATILVAVAGPGMNFILGTVICLVHSILIWRGVELSENVSQIFIMAVGTNYILLFFNLLPLPPLDGGHVAQSLAPYRYRHQFDQIARYGPFVLLAIIAIPSMGRIFTIPAIWLFEHMYGLFHLILGG